MPDLHNPKRRNNRHTMPPEKSGILTDEQLRWLLFVQAFKTDNNTPFPTFTELLDLAKDFLKTEAHK